MAEDLPNSVFVADLPGVVEAFKKCRKSDGTIATDHYLAAINELFRLFHSFGKGISLALQGMDNCIKRLELLRVTGAGCSYSTFEQFLKHEKQVDMDINNNKSGTESTNKLYNFVNFMLEFLRKLEEALEKNQSYKIVDKIAIYQNTVASLHPAYVQATVKVLLIGSPGRQELLQKLGVGGRGLASPREILRDILLSASPVQERLHHLLRQESSQSLECDMVKDDKRVN